jgi:endonuclease-3
VNVARQEHIRVVNRVQALLEREYGGVGEVRRRAPLDELVFSLLREDASERATLLAYQKLKNAFVDWNEARVSLPDEMEQLVSPLHNGADKARRLRSVLEQIFAKENQVSLDFLIGGDYDSARRYLSGLDGLSPRVVASVLFNALGFEATPVDRTMGRLAYRLGLIGDQQAVRRLQEILDETLVPPKRQSFHRVFSLHAERVCVSEHQECAPCPLARECRTGWKVVKTLRRSSKRAKSRRPVVRRARRITAPPRRMAAKRASFRRKTSRRKRR